MVVTQVANDSTPDVVLSYTLTIRSTSELTNTVSSTGFSSLPGAAAARAVRRRAERWIMIAVVLTPLGLSRYISVLANSNTAKRRRRRYVIAQAVRLRAERWIVVAVEFTPLILSRYIDVITSSSTSSRNVTAGAVSLRAVRRVVVAVDVTPFVHTRYINVVAGGHAVTIRGCACGG